jgi:hypothetical protein
MEQSYIQHTVSIEMDMITAGDTVKASWILASAFSEYSLLPVYCITIASLYQSASIDDFSILQPEY